jgi:sulfur transfer protein SufE
MASLAAAIVSSWIVVVLAVATVTTPAHVVHLKTNAMASALAAMVLLSADE